MQHLAAGCPSIFNAGLASSFNNFSACLASSLNCHLAHLGHCEHALEVNRNAVDLFRQLALAAGHPGVVNADLASSLNNLSARLSQLGHHEHALEVNQEAVDLFQQLATDRPGVFNSGLASSSLNCLSARLACSRSS